MWEAITRSVMAHPVITVVATVGLLLGAAGWVLAIELGTNGISTLPKESGSRHAFEVLNAEFTQGVMTADIVIDAPDVNAAGIQQGIAALSASLDQDAIFGETTVEVNEAGDLALVRAVMKSDYSSDEAREALERLRGEYIPQAFDGEPATVQVGGATASITDAVDSITGYLPIVFAFVLGLSFLLLLLVFRSIVVPLKAVAMNALSVGAAYGVLVLVFQKGYGAEWFGFEQTPVIEFWLPLALFSILFGLSMDYHVFLLSRIKEHYDETGNNTESVAFGLRSTGSIITGAALIMVAVFGGFAMGDLSMFQQMGFGLAVAVILDATVIRSFLVPAGMKLLGQWNWYFPAWLEWLPKINIEGQQAPEAPAVGSAPAGSLATVPIRVPSGGSD